MPIRKVPSVKPPQSASATWTGPGRRYDGHGPHRNTACHAASSAAKNAARLTFLGTAPLLLEHGLDLVPELLPDLRGERADVGVLDLPRPRDIHDELPLDPPGPPGQRDDAVGEAGRL